MLERGKTPADEGGGTEPGEWEGTGAASAAQPKSNPVQAEDRAEARRKALGGVNTLSE
jgi:hypothetical protein